MLDIDAQAHPFLFTTRLDYSTPASPVWLRDQLANAELTAGLAELGIARPASPIVNMPPTEVVDPRRLLGGDELLRIPVDHLRPGDFLVVTTRLPKDDIEEGNRMWVEPGQTDLERWIFDWVDRYLAILSRSHIKLSPYVRDALPEELVGRANFSSYQSGTFGLYKEMNAGRGFRGVDDETGRWVPAFVLRTDALWPGGPGAIVAFSMESLSTAAWCWRLRRDLSRLVAQPGFHFWELCPEPLPERPTDPSWAADWAAKPIVDLPLVG